MSRIVKRDWAIATDVPHLWIAWPATRDSRNKNKKGNSVWVQKKLCCNFAVIARAPRLLRSAFRIDERLDVFRFNYDSADFLQADYGPFGFPQLPFWIAVIRSQSVTTGHSVRRFSLTIERSFYIVRSFYEKEGHGSLSGG